MTTKKDLRGAMRDIPRKQPLACNTIAYTVLKHLHEHGTVLPPALHGYMPDRRQNTTTVLAYVERLENLGYAYVSDSDEISITLAGRAFIDDKPQAPTPKYCGIPAAPRIVNIWTEPLKGYEASMRAGRRVA